jgi:hypothetical protein
MITGNRKEKTENYFIIVKLVVNNYNIKITATS